VEGESPYASVSSAPAWRGLLARGALLSACATRLAQLYDLSFAYASVLGALNDLAKAAGAARAAASDGVAVSDAAYRWGGAISEWLDSPDTTAVDERLLLEEALALSATAESVDPFRTLFAAVGELAVGVYGDRWPSPVLRLNDLPAHPRNPPDHYAITAKTTPTDPPAVTLMVHPTGFGPASFAAVPCLLAHECICHVPAKQDRVKNDSRFAEGLMDWTASYVFDASVAHILPDLSEAAKAHSGAFRELFATATTPEGRARRFGHIAANHLVVLTMDDLDVSQAEAERIVARVARDLNCVQAPIDKKDLLTAKLLGLSEPTPLLSDVLKGVRPAADLL